MSNHEIGHCMNDFLENILEMYDQGELSRDAVHKIVRFTLNVVGGADGNEYEALENMTRTRCACCLKEYTSIDEIVTCENANDVMRKHGVKSGWSWWHDILDEKDFSGESVCKKCFKEQMASGVDEAAVQEVLEHCAEPRDFY